jgi:hypothetical protein
MKKMEKNIFKKKPKIPGLTAEKLLGFEVQTAPGSPGFLGSGTPGWNP